MRSLLAVVVKASCLTHSALPEFTVHMQEPGHRPGEEFLDPTDPHIILHKNLCDW